MDATEKIQHMRGLARTKEDSRLASARLVAANLTGPDGFYKRQFVARGAISTQ